MGTKAEPQEERIERALALWTGGGISFGAAAKVAGVSLSELAVAAYARGFEPHYSPETAAEDLVEECPEGAQA